MNDSGTETTAMPVADLGVSLVTEKVCRYLFVMIISFFLCIKISYNSSPESTTSLYRTVHSGPLTFYLHRAANVPIGCANEIQTRNLPCHLS